MRLLELGTRLCVWVGIIEARLYSIISPLLTNLFDYFQSHGALAGDYVRVVIAINVRQVLFFT